MEAEHYQNIITNTEIKPDVIIDYIVNPEVCLPMSVVYVRPETNEVHYEKAIILGVAPYADVVYLANLNGRLFIKDALILEHYSSQYRFAIYAREEIRKYPDMVRQFEEYFNVPFEEAKILGSFEAIIKLKISDEELFNTIVDSVDFLKMYGQTIKRIGDHFIVNYDIPAIIQKYTPKANVFVIAARFRNPEQSFIEVNQSIFEQIKAANAPIISDNEMKVTEWFERIKRTYHFSRNHVMAMFDMMDFIIRINNQHLTFSDTPLGKILIDHHGFRDDMLWLMKSRQIYYICVNGNRKLINLIDEANKKNFEECCDLIKSIEKITD